jgi:hypothetical protein
VPPDCRQFTIAVGADVEHLRLFACREGIQPYRKDRKLAGAAGRFIVPARMTVEPSRCVRVDVTDMVGVVPVACQSIRIVLSSALL